METAVTAVDTEMRTKVFPVKMSPAISIFITSPVEPDFTPFDQRRPLPAPPRSRHLVATFVLRGVGPTSLDSTHRQGSCHIRLPVPGDFTFMSAQITTPHQTP